MNLGSHIAVAAKVEESNPVFWLGAALPDLGAIGRFRLLGLCADPDITTGIVFHHRTDEAFHRHPWFTTRQHDLRERLATAGLSRGAARAVAHVGPELLLDGSLLQAGPGARRQRDNIETALATITQLGPVLGPLVPKSEQAWLDHLEQVVSWGTPMDYHDPGAVAARLHRILSRRPRLAMQTSDVEIVAKALAETWPGIQSTAQDFVAEIASQLGIQGTDSL